MALLNRFCRCPSCLTTVVLWFGLCLANGQKPVTEYEVKAVYMIKFIQFVDWPDRAFKDPDSPLVIGVLGSDPFGQTLDAAAEGEMAKNRHITIRRFHELKEVDSCQVLFVGSSERGRVHSILEGLKGQTILSVSDLEDFCKEGGAVRFLMEDNKVRFRINEGAIKDADLRVSSKLLRLAQLIEGNAP